ncbi:Bor family protein [Aliamphritea spongicola]|uniref:Bor family protein n=1 Tax=Aliamphritea spongicola TaxID=707589 RepID=UPI00196B5ADC|nr:Bor family protein [Aliamphritea spongicola]MBN3561771.1 Bor family protein [Aliamphritea spongicola]
MNKILLALTAAAFISGCSTQTFNINGTTQAPPQTEDSQVFFINGIGQEKSTNAAEICGGADKVIKVETQETFVNGFLGFITLGIYTPRDARVYCR